MNRKHFYTTVILLAFLAIGIQPALAVINIPGDTGFYSYDGDRTYTLNQNVSDTIILSNPFWDEVIEHTPEDEAHDELDRIIFDGGGYKVEVGNDYGIAFAEDDPENGYITIQNLIITNCTNGIDIHTATRINVIDTDISDCDYGISIGRSGTCIVTDNTISDCTEYGIWLSGSAYNTIYNNNFINNNNQAYAAELPGYPSIGNVFDFGGSGNYWSDYMGVDSDGDGIGDTWYTFTGGQDEYPLMPTAETKLEELIEKVEGYNGDFGINNALDAKLQNALDALTAKNAGQRQDAVNKMQAFINAVEAQSGNKITVEVADELIADAQYIIDLILSE